ncbi:MAG: sugar ABC transporter permease [Chloroflexota bacterium]|nr:sugar ABC transporter permease [Chloroflexota bacterium]
MAVLSPVGRAQAAPPTSTARRLLGRDWTVAWPFLAPLIIVLLGLIAYPFVSAIALSLQRKMVGGEAVWIGPGNYYALLFSEQYGALFRKTAWISFMYVAVSIGLKFVLGMAMALLLNERFRGRTLMRAVLFIPWAMPTLIVALAWRWIYEGTPNGLLNLILIDYLGSDRIVQWLANPRLALWSVIVAAVWQGTPFWTMMFLAGMQAIPSEMYEAAKLDGANVFQRFAYITMPLLRSVIIITTLLSTIWTANSINFIYVLTRGGPSNATMTFPMLAFDIGIVGARQMGLAAAVSVMFFPFFIVAIFILTKRMLATEARA